MFQDKFFHRSEHRITAHCTSKIPFIQQATLLVTASGKLLKTGWIGFFFNGKSSIQHKGREN